MGPRGRLRRKVLRAQETNVPVNNLRGANEEFGNGAKLTRVELIQDHDNVSMERFEEIVEAL